MLPDGHAWQSPATTTIDDDDTAKNQTDHFTAYIKIPITHCVPG